MKLLLCCLLLGVWVVLLSLWVWFNYMVGSYLVLCELVVICEVLEVEVELLEVFFVVECGGLVVLLDE